MENTQIKNGQKVFITGGACKGRNGIITRLLNGGEYEVLTDIQSFMPVYTIVDIDEFNLVD
jgi:hypothetical protein